MLIVSTFAMNFQNLTDNYVNFQYIKFRLLFYKARDFDTFLITKNIMFEILQLTRHNIF